jgi:hypothetical protein
MTCYDCVNLLDCDYYTQCGHINMRRIPHRTPDTRQDVEPCEYFYSKKQRALDIWQEWWKREGKEQGEG